MNAMPIEDMSNTFIETSRLKYILMMEKKMVQRISTCIKL